MKDLYTLYKERCRELLDNGLAHSELNQYENFKDILDEVVFKVFMRDKQNRKNKRYRTKEKFKELIIIYNNSKCHTKNLVFGTLTLNDETLSLQERTRVKKIDKWLKSHFLISIVNKDFGDKTGREHYHFLGITSQALETKFHENGKPIKSKKGYIIHELVQKDYKLGFEPDLCIIDFDKSDIDKTVNYLLKLNNHSNKILAKNRVRVIKSDLMKLFIKE